MSVKKRNLSVDVLRGIAMLMVVLGHTMTGCTTNSEETLLFNVIWSLQMPIFFLISGYVSCFSNFPCSRADFYRLLGKKTKAYLLPWVVWTFFIRGVLWQQEELCNLQYVLWHMDSGYWFLFSLWTITIIYSVAQYLARGYGKSWCVWIGYAAGGVILLTVGIIAGLSFLAIKLTLYYMLFFAIGGLLPSVYRKYRLSKKNYAVAIFMFGVLYCIILQKYNLYQIPDNIYGILLRFMAAICGCVVLGALCNKIASLRRISCLLSWIGQNTLGIYLSHYLLLCLLKFDPIPMIRSREGIALVALNFTITSVLSALTAKLLDKTKLTRVLFLGK